MLRGHLSRFFSEKWRYCAHQDTQNWSLCVLFVSRPSGEKSWRTTILEPKARSSARLPLEGKSDERVTTLEVLCQNFSLSNLLWLNTVLLFRFKTTAPLDLRCGRTRICRNAWLVSHDVGTCSSRVFVGPWINEGQRAGSCTLIEPHTCSLKNSRGQPE